MQELRAQLRDQMGKKTNTLRKAGFLPAVVYGDGVASQAISVSGTEFERIYQAAGESSLLQLEVGDRSYPVVIHDIAYDPLTDQPIHADFYAVRMDRALQVKVPLQFIGESPAVKNEGGVLIKVVHELEIEAMPGDLPRALSIDLSSLAAMGDRIFVRNISAPNGVKIIASADEVIAIVEAPRSDEELASLASAPVTEPIEVKTEREIAKEAKAESEAKETEAQKP